MDIVYIDKCRYKIQVQKSSGIPAYTGHFKHWVLLENGTVEINRKLQILTQELHSLYPGVCLWRNAPEVLSQDASQNVVPEPFSLASV
jgi:hypothetical protein